jgi:hypothetical protein
MSETAFVYTGNMGGRRRAKNADVVITMLLAELMLKDPKRSRKVRAIRGCRNAGLAVHAAQLCASFVAGLDFSGIIRLVRAAKFDDLRRLNNWRITFIQIIRALCGVR